MLPNHNRLPSHSRHCVYINICHEEHLKLKHCTLGSVLATMRACSLMCKHSAETAALKLKDDSVFEHTDPQTPKQQGNIRRELGHPQDAHTQPCTCTDTRTYWKQQKRKLKINSNFCKSLQNKRHGEETAEWERSFLFFAFLMSLLSYKVLTPLTAVTQARLHTALF